MINLAKEQYKQCILPSEYDKCRFSENKLEYAKNWIKKQNSIINFEIPTNIVERICKYKLEDIENPNIEYINLKQRWSDKVNVYNELEKINLSELQLDYVYKEYNKSFDESILYELDKNPSNWKYIIKCNHGSGWNLIYTPKITSHNYIVEQMNKWLNTNYAYISGLEMQYKWIKPGYVVQPIYVEKPLDWSFWCENGNIEGIGLTRKLGKNYEEYIAFVNSDGNMNNWFIGMIPEQKKLFTNQKLILDKMKPYVYKLCKNFKFVRVDMYYINNKIYFGELTFTPCSGILDISYI